MMYKLLRDLVFFSIFAILGYCITVYAIGEYGPNWLRKNFLGDKTGGYGFTALRLRDVEKLKNIDVLIIGSSHAYRGLDTRIFSKEEITSFNLGSSAQTPIQTEMLLKKYLKELAPKVVIYEVNPGPFEADGVESAIDILASSETIDWNAIKMTARINNIKVYNSTIFYFFKKNFRKTKKVDMGKKLKDGVDTYIEGGGFVERNLSNDNPVKQESRNLKLRQSQMQSFERIMNMLSDTNAELWLVRTPVTENLYSSFSNNEEVDQFFLSRGNFINLQNRIKLDDSLDFFDSHHLNQNGASKVTKELLKLMKE